MGLTSDTPKVWEMTQYLDGEQKKTAYCLVVAKLDYDILSDKIKSLQEGYEIEHEAYRLENEEKERVQAELNRKQARIHELMLGYCPDEMTPEQTAEWAHPPAKKEWIGLTMDDIWQTIDGCTLAGDLHTFKFAYAIDFKLKKKNSG